jgi:protocatechuate 3,4-dioxygenase, beta subunit
MVEIWQCNAAGRYHHSGDQHDAPLDPNFYGGGRYRADEQGRYEFITIKPGAYPWKNHHNAWRPAHIHFSLFGPAFATRLITQMYFPNDPLLAFDPIYNSVPAGARERLQASFDMETTRPEWALAYKFDIVLRGRNATPME